MPWPSDFENILGGVDIAIFNVATLRTEMRPDRKRLLDDLPTPRAFLRGEAGVHSNDLMSSTLSLGSEEVEERAPGGVHDTFCQMMVFDHAVNIEVLDSDMMVLLGVLLGSLEMEITALPLDLQVGLCRMLGSLTPSLRAFLAACNRALLAPERGFVLDGGFRRNSVTPMRRGERVVSRTLLDRPTALRSSVSTCGGYPCRSRTGSMSSTA